MQASFGCFTKSFLFVYENMDRAVFNWIKTANRFVDMELPRYKGIITEPGF